MGTLATRARTGEQSAAFLSGGGTCGAAIRAFDWDSSPIGAVEGWPQSLKTALSLMLGAAQPVYIAWGDDLISFYNDGYLPIVGDKHPGIGAPFRKLWAEIWSDFEPLVRDTLAGKPQFFIDTPIALAGRPGVELGYFTFSYTPLRDDEGVIRGFYCACTETTDRVETEHALRSKEARLRAVLDSISEGMGIIGHDYRILDVNAEGLRMDGRPREEIVGHIHWDVHPNADPALRRAYERAMTERVPEALVHRYEWPDGRVSWIDLRVYPIEEGIGVFYRDVTAERERSDALAHSEERLRLAARAAGFGTWFLDTRTGLGEWDAAAAAVMGLDGGATTFDHALVAGLLHPDDVQRVQNGLAEVLAGRGGDYVDQARGTVPAADGSTRWIESRGTVTLGDDGAPVGAIGILRDISEEKRAEQHQRLMMDELSHRAKNLLAIVQSVAQQSFRGSGPPEEMRAAFEGRLGALGAAHAILTREKWETAPLAEIMRDTIGALRESDGRITLAGEDIAVSPKTGVSLAMAVHELATNAVKYGSLSVPGGTVEVSWGISEGRFRLTWRERGGPPVEPPQGRGFGTRMIERGLAGELGGTVTIAFEPDGVVCTVDAPLRSLAGPRQ